MSLINYYRSLHPRTRMLLGAGVIVYGTLGLYLSDVAEEKLGFTPTAEDKRKLDEIVPKIRTVERRD
ncbi:Similar to hypothetical protein PTRG_11321 [Pyrenophora tritici-repentis Pt-1C-BFP]; acc. no. XP_001941652 [Pyronema omphalodes CBS 100304]|uniref:Uncharacterized protein n=1 Tax=Pyronema omphalodes (strain CBS 100304) TaxID=1076935 RepID=U4LEQ0_PYROM|nr:Similar to hypothetical protein PTRG_11321 [Pyrenophora tritici-repentis Pt-1C-BFP]; acc. no. XP_001941652 [Pyronema omphalodes CBS 100304]